MIYFEGEVLCEGGGLCLIFFRPMLENKLHNEYRKSSNNSPGAYLPTKKFWVGGLFELGAYLNGGLINLEE